MTNVGLNGVTHIVYIQMYIYIYIDVYFLISGRMAEFNLTKMGDNLRVAGWWGHCPTLADVSTLASRSK